MSLNVSPSTFCAATIPIVDMNKYENPALKDEFLEDLAKALSKGFFGVINSKIDPQIVKKGYDAFGEFFALPLDEKMKINDPKLNGQRGFVPGETALNGDFPDGKEFLHIGLTDNLWPTNMDLEGPGMRLYSLLKDVAQPILKGMSILLKQDENFLTDMTAKGSNLMRPIHYPPNPREGVWARKHTDIDLLTVLPFASEKGLEVKIDRKWISVQVPEDALIFNVGDMAEAYSNGKWPSCKHQVVSRIPDTTRESIVFFVHPTSDTMIKPLGEESPQYPEGTQWDYLSLRLKSLRLLNREMDQQVDNGDFIKKIKVMVENKTASKSVHRWYRGHQKTLEK